MEKRNKLIEFIAGELSSFLRYNPFVKQKSYDKYINVLTHLRDCPDKLIHEYYKRFMEDQFTFEKYVLNEISFV